MTTEIYLPMPPPTEAKQTQYIVSEKAPATKQTPRLGPTTTCQFAHTSIEVWRKLDYWRCSCHCCPVHHQDSQRLKYVILVLTALGVIISSMVAFVVLPNSSIARLAWAATILLLVWLLRRWVIAPKKFKIEQYGENEEVGSSKMV
ncbi:hypothetical protein CC86DRAFT_381003 [Ophiobolus disseminans]|uniref:Uncharacterized protein n=1 Tax=Ophiobolus disseminans TaxID=1469910 RepID=A0A6A7A3X8_9PLEO|nr:hypothetical protein CC86DRAFT_381003 [Ophiobolus disseminans]